jgi:serine/threonine protein kinase
VLDAPPRVSPAAADAGQPRLAENYRALIRQRAIRQPVPYHFVRELGKGRQGVVFLAVREGARGCLTRHAVKLHDPLIYSNASRYWTDMGRIAGQVSKLQPMHCDQLVTPEAYEEADGIGYVQMAALDGVDLQFLLESTHLAIARSQCADAEWQHFMDALFHVEEGRFMLRLGLAMHILKEVLLGLAAMHEAGFLHADIKPSNIMIDRMGSVKLVDFGRAAQIGERIHILLGSPLYMAPETHRLEPGQVQSDLFSTGLVFLEMMRGPFLLEYDTRAEADLVEFKAGLVDRLEALMPMPARGTRLLLSKFLRSFLNPEPSRRFASARDAEESHYKLHDVQRAMGMMGTPVEYERELKRYLAKITDPATGHLNPRLD